MKKITKILVDKLKQGQQGRLSNRFSAIKGGFKAFTLSMESTNDGYTNVSCTVGASCNTDPPQGMNIKTCNVND